MSETAEPNRQTNKAVTLGKPLVFGGAFTAAAISFGAGVMALSPPFITALGWALPTLFFGASGVWLFFTVIAIRRYRWLGALTLLGVPFAAISPLAALLIAIACDWGRGPCI